MTLPSTSPATYRAIAFASCLAALAGLSSCATQPEPYQGIDTTKYTLENTDRFLPLDRATQQFVSCTSLQDYALADGRKEVVASLKNRDNHKLEIQVSCAFKDAQGLSILEETPWQSVALVENATEAVRFTASGPATGKYTIRVRQNR